MCMAAAMQGAAGGECAPSALPPPACNERMCLVTFGCGGVRGLGVTGTRAKGHRAARTFGAKIADVICARAAPCLVRARRRIALFLLTAA